MSQPFLAATSASPSQWDGFVAAQPDGHILQSSRWGDLKARFGWLMERVALTREGRLVAGAQVLFRPLPWGQTLAYVPRGPLVDWRDPQQVQALLDGIADVARHRRAVALKIEPELPDDPQMAALLSGYGFLAGHTIQPRSTIVLDLQPGEDAILARMKSKWRYNVRLAERKGVQVREGDRADLAPFQRLVDETGQRDRFGVHSAEYHAAAYDLFVDAGQAVWLLAEAKGQILAAIVVFALGDKGWYFWGASGSAHRNLMPNHALQWAAIRWARERGCRSYDLWGIPDEVGSDPAAYKDPKTWGSGGLWGVYRFKRGFGGRVVRSVGAWDLVYSVTGYWIYRLAIGLRQRSIA
jgi:lipid II:glycine glycyltransferase (peptidoglycan interpeptide bridge formation enzyme)